LQQAVLDLPDAEAGERRLLLSVQVDAPGGDLWVHDTHLNYRMQDGRAREKQVLAIDEAVTARSGDRPQIVMGDFNARPTCDEIRFMRGEATLGGRRTYYQDAWAKTHPEEPGWTWASANAFADRLHFLDLDRRIDYIFVTTARRDGRGRIHDCRMVFDQPDANGVFASDHFGVMAAIQVSAG
jgi:endonuclease/exonuclease/phosphatase family metal-dependent hydrolase